MQDEILETRGCSECGAVYPVTTVDRYFLQKFDMPEPGRCPECRDRRRQLFLNVLNLYRRPCDATGEMIISQYAADAPRKVFSQKFWYSDGFDALSYGRPFDFSRTFFAQFAELSAVVPRPALFTGFTQDENSEYSNHAALNKNCYMVFDTATSRDCFYLYGVEQGRDSMECHRSVNIELCYEAIDCTNCYQSAFLQSCESCSDSILLQRCIGCEQCIMCSNLSHKKLHYLNQPISAAEFKRIRAQLASREKLAQAAAEFAEFCGKFPRKYMEGVLNENVTGDYLVRCKNAFECFDCRGVHDGRYCTQSFMTSRDNYCTRELGDGELFYESANSGSGYNLRFCFNCYPGVHDLTYCDYCVNGAANLFGCIGVNRKSFCVLNTEYGQGEYFELTTKITEHMRRTGEWGQQFPAEHSPFEYNNSEAQIFYPLEQSEAVARGFRWRTESAGEGRGPNAEVPDTIDAAGLEIAGTLYACAECSRNFRLIAPEVKLYRKLQVPPPTCCFFCRHRARIAKKNRRRLYERICSGCGVGLRSTYSSESPECVLCERCYPESLA